MKENTPTQMWCVKTASGTFDTCTLSYLRSDAIKKFIEGTTLTWKACHHIGHRVKKVIVTINPL